MWTWMRGRTAARCLSAAAVAAPLPCTLAAAWGSNSNRTSDASPGHRGGRRMPVFGQRVTVARCEGAQHKERRFAGKVFLVTGASSGIGAVVAKLLAEDGAHVVLTARRLERLAQVKGDIERQGGSASVEAMDVMQSEEVEAVLQGILSKHGKLDGAFNNAGAGSGAGVTGDMKAFKAGFDLNFYGLYHCMHAELKVMTQQGHGAIVNNLSIYASLASQTPIGCYCAAKRAGLALQECAALEVAASGVRVNSVSPGFTTPSESLEGMLEAVPGVAKKIISPLVPPGGGLLKADADVYPTVAFLLDEASGTITGVDIQVAGGWNIPVLNIPLD